MGIGKNMDKSNRKEIKIGIFLFTIFNVINFITDQIGTEIYVFELLLGGIAGVAFAEIIIGSLPETIYVKLKNFKKNIIRL